MRGVLCMLAALSWAGPASAQPSVWSLAAQPEAVEAVEASAQAEALLGELAVLGPGLPSGAPAGLRASSVAARSRMLSKAKRILERAGAAESHDPQLRSQLARVYYVLSNIDPDPAHLEQASVHFRFVGASEQAPTTMRAEAYRELAICLARLARHDEEIAAYDLALALEPDPVSHAIILANQAEGQMARGLIIEAVRGYRAALRATSGIQMADTGVTTLWGLAVALDRAGDLSGALEHISLARSYDPLDLRINGPSWFFVPDYDEAWYSALGHWQRARDPEGGIPDADPTDARLARQEAYRDAEAAWRSFLARALPDDPWLPLAGQRLSAIEREHAAFRAESPLAGARGSIDAAPPSE